MDNVSQLSAVSEDVLAGGVSTELEKLIPGEKTEDYISNTCG